MEICGVVVWYNPDIEEVDNIKTYLNHLDRVIVVDNSINDNSNLLEGIYKIEYIANNDNLGIAKALNIGCYKAIEYGYNYVLTMDQDSRFEEVMINNFIYKFHKKLKEDKSIAIFAPVIDDNDEYGYVEKIITSGSILNTKSLQEVNGFDNELFIDEVDFDLCFKLLNNNYKLYKFKDIKLNHKLGNTKIVKIFNKEFTTMNHGYIRKYYIIRNKFVVKQRYPQYTGKYFKEIVIHFIKIILGEDDKILKLKYSFKGYLDYRRGTLGRIGD